MSDSVFQGSLFSTDFLQDSITRVDDWQRLTDPEIDELADNLLAVFSRFPTAQTPNESQTEDDLIWPILARLGWTASLRQQNLAARGRDDVPDGLLFEDAAAKVDANAFSDEWKRYGVGLAIVESKRWQRPLDRQSGRRGEETAPSTQMLRYLRRVEDLTTGKLRWGILTNGARWRLYFQGARSVSEQFFELDLAAALAVPGHDGGLFALSEERRRHWLRVFALVFGRDGFLPSPGDTRTFHQRAIDEARFYEERVAGNLSGLVFGTVFPELVKAISAAAPEAPLQEVREAGLVVLYRLLFILYAEDRDLLPVRDGRYDDYSLRQKARNDVALRKDRNDTFSDTAARYWSVLDDLCRIIGGGDRSIGLPPYNGGLFDRDRTPLLSRVRLGDDVMANVIDALSFEHTEDGRKYINYRDLGVQQLGSIYERLLEHEVVRDDETIVIRPNVFARKVTGSYYTPDDLVGLIIRETTAPLVSARMDAFSTKVRELETSGQSEARRLGVLAGLDPAERLLELKICDPAMGSGHFLVSLVDHLTDQVIAAMAEAEAQVTFVDYVSPLIARVESIRNTILRNADERGWTIDPEQLDDRHIVRRMILKRCIYGVDKNPMAVELAKLALWLHTFTVGAPLSFLDHHLRCGDSLFGSWVRRGIDRASDFGAPLLLHGPMTRATRAASSMQVIEGLTDAEIAEAHRSKDIFDEVRNMTASLDAFLSLIHAFDWLRVRSRSDRILLTAFFDGQFGDPVQIALGTAEMSSDGVDAERFAPLLARARALAAEERFLNWQVAFPGVWSDWEGTTRHGGFDAVVGNPPWDRMKLQQVEWFAARRRDIAMAQRAADRQAMISDLESARDNLALDFLKANDRAEAAARTAKTIGDYPLLSGGDLNLYSLFVERALQIVKPGGMVGLVVPIGIGTDKTASSFFSGISKEKKVSSFLAFENKRGWLFPDVHHEDQPTIFIIGTGHQIFDDFAFGVKLHAIPDEEYLKSNRLTWESCRKINPNTGTIPIFRTKKDADITTRIYERLPILAYKENPTIRTWPVRYSTMFHMTNDSGHFRTRAKLEEEEGAYPVGGRIWRSATGNWLPVFEGKMVSIYNHRYASVGINPNNISGQGVAIHTTVEDLSDPDFVNHPRYWIEESKVNYNLSYALGFNDICNTNNQRSLISALVPKAAYGNKLPILIQDDDADKNTLIYLVANMNSIICDYVARQKIQSRNLNKYILEQLPIISPDSYVSVIFGSKSAGTIVREAVLELTYAANDMASFARETEQWQSPGILKAPFIWDEDRRLKLRAKLDALYLHLYGVTNRDDVRYVYSTFPIVEREEIAAYGHFRSRDLCLAYMSALAAGDPDADVDM